VLHPARAGAVCAEHAMTFQCLERVPDIPRSSRLDNCFLMQQLSAQDAKCGTRDWFVIGRPVEFDAVWWIGQHRECLVGMAGADVLCELGNRSAGLEAVHRPQQHH
jgi:hypothetical protein